MTQQNAGHHGVRCWHCRVSSSPSRNLCKHLLRNKLNCLHIRIWVMRVFVGALFVF